LDGSSDFKRHISSAEGKGLNKLKIIRTIERFGIEMEH
jgi:hypothetical protein